MPDAPQTLGDLIKAKVLTIEQLHVAADVFMADPSTSLYVFEGAGCPVNPAESVRAHQPTADVLADPKAGRGFKLTMVRTVLVLKPATSC